MKDGSKMRRTALLQQAARISALQTFEIRNSNEFFFLSLIVKKFSSKKRRLLRWEKIGTIV